MNCGYRIRRICYKRNQRASGSARLDHAPVRAVYTSLERMEMPIENIQELWKNIAHGKSA